MPRSYWGMFALLVVTELSALDLPTLPNWTTEHVMNLGEAVDCGTSSEWRYSAAGAEILVRAQKEILVHGRDRFGQIWRVQAGYPGDAGCRFFAHDLDRNGARDLIFLTANSGSGPAGLTMTIIAFDRARRPVPWQATAPFFLEGNRILNFIDLDGDKAAELLFQHVEEIGMSGDTGISTTLYKITDGYVRRVTGRVGGKTFPIRYPTEMRFLDEPDLANALPEGGRRERIAAVRPRENGPCWLKGIDVTEGGITVASDSLAAEECKGYLESKRGHRVLIPLMAVLDLPSQGRFIDINYSLDVVNQAIKSKLRVALMGRSCETGCRPFIMWARPR